MRYRRTVKVRDAILAGGACALGRLTVHPEPLIDMAEGITVFAGWMLVFSRITYWDVLSDRIVFRNFFGKTTWMFADLDYVGPGPSAMAWPVRGKQWLMVKNKNGKKKLQPWPLADAQQFIKEMQGLVPRITKSLEIS